MESTKVKYKDKIEWHNEDRKRHREDGPAIEYTNGDKYWCINGKFHREDGPAIEYTNGDKTWFLNGKLHREDGPAVEYVRGSTFWYLNGKCISKENWENEVVKFKLKRLSEL